MAKMTEKKSISLDKTVLLAPHLAFELSCQVGNKGVTANAEGRKIIPAGTVVGGTEIRLTNPKAVLVVANDTTAQGVLRNDVDVTNGNANATLIIRGVVDASKCPTISVEAKTALSLIQFVNGGKN